MQYLPWAIFNYLNPLVAIAYAFTGFRVERVTPQEPGDIEGEDVPSTEHPPAA